MDKLIVIFKNREEWRNWLSNNFETAKEIFLSFPTSKCREISISYNDSVEEALCFNWIDGVAGKLDENHQLRRFTPRRKNSKFSRLNIERLIYLDSLDLIHPKFKDEVKKIISVPFVFPKDIIEELKKDEITWKNFQSFSDSYKRIRISHIQSARSDEKEFKKKLAIFVKKTKEKKIISGFGGSEKYYKN